MALARFNAWRLEAAVDERELIGVDVIRIDGISGCIIDWELHHKITRYP